MKLRTGIVILAFVLCGAAALAQDPSSPFLPFYFVEGDLIHDLGPGTPINHRVVFFETDPRILGVNKEFTGISPQTYRINVFESQYFGKFSVGAGRTYLIAVPTGTDGYGTDPVDIELTGTGFERKDLNLVLGGGSGLLPPAGTVPLGIERNGSNVRLTWDGAVYSTIDIYRMTGNGSGEYSNTFTVWSEMGRDRTGGFDEDPGVFASSDREIYYKAIESARRTDAATLVPIAWAVGKFDYVLANEYNLLTLPFVLLNGTAIDEAFYDQLRRGSIEVYARDDLTGLYSKSQFIGSDWSVIAGSAISFSPGYAYWVRVPSAVRGTTGLRVSLLGGVANTDFSRALYGASDHPTVGGYSLCGWPYPYRTDLVTGGLPVRGTDEIFLRFEDRELYQKVINEGSVWTKLLPDLPDIECVPGAGYWYRNRTTDFDWTPPKP